MYNEYHLIASFGYYCYNVSIDVLFQFCYSSVITMLTFKTLARCFFFFFQNLIIVVDWMNKNILNVKMILNAHDLNIYT